MMKGWDDEKANRRASTNWVERLRTELGLDTRPLGDKTRVEVGVSPEYLYGVLDEVVGLLRDAGIDDHPLRGEDV
jgi:hypothetical protein